MKQRGFGFLHLMMVLIVAVAGLGYWKHQSKKMEAQATEQRQLEADQKRKLSAERDALEKRLAAEKHKSEFEKSIASLQGVYNRWQDAERLALSTSRIALAQPVASLQQIKRETEAIVVPPCLDEAKSHLVSGMNWAIEGFIQFMTDKKLSEFTTPRFFSSAKNEFDEYQKSNGSCSE